MFTDGWGISGQCYDAIGNKVIRKMTLHLLAQKYNTGVEYTRDDAINRLGIYFKDQINNSKRSGGYRIIGKVHDDPTSSSIESILKTLSRIIMEVDDVKVSLTSNTRLIDDVGLDSVAMMDLITAVEQHYAISIGLDHDLLKADLSIESFNNSGALASLIGRKLAENSLIIDPDRYLNSNEVVNESTNYIITDYCQNPSVIKHIINYFSNHENEFCSSVINNNKYAYRYKNNNDLFVHIRAGDVDVFSGHRQIIPKQQFYESRIEFLKNKYDNIYLSSDNINHDFCQRLIEKYAMIPYAHDCDSCNKVNTILFGSTCKYIIVSSGSYSFLIALLSFFSDKVYFSDEAGLLIIDDPKDKAYLLASLQHNGKKIKRWHPDYYPMLIKQHGNKYIQNI